MSTLKQLHRQVKARRNGRPAFTLLELIVVLLVLGILAAIAVPTFNRVKENSVERAAQTTLEAIDRNGEAIAFSDPGLSDAAVATAALAEVSAPEGMTITRNTSGDGKEVTVEYTNGGIVASGKVAFADGVGTIVAASVTAPTTTTTTTTTVAPTTTTTVAPTTTTTVAPTTTTTVAPLSCAQGGTCAVGDTGPGGGIVFYVHPSGTFTSTGSDCGSSCKYLEVAQAEWSGVQWSGNTSVSVPGAWPAAQAINLGTGYRNTSLAYNQSNAHSAIKIAWEYSNNDKTDWHLPSERELNELCKYARQQTTGNTSVNCTSSGTLRSGYNASQYWSSSEWDATRAYEQHFNEGHRGFTNKSSGFRVRPIRAF